MTDLPWLRLYRRESPRFARLSLLARGLHAELLKATDSDGVVYLADRRPHLGVAMLLGAHRGERRKLGLCLQELLDAGYLAHDPEAQTLTFPAFCERQSGAGTELEEGWKGAGKGLGVSRNRAGRSAKPAKSLGPPLREEKIRKEEDNPAKNLPTGAEDFNFPEADPTELHRMTAEAHRKHARAQMQAGPRWDASAERWIVAAQWATETGAIRGLAAVEVYRQALAGFYADAKAKAQGFPLPFFFGQPDRYLPDPNAGGDLTGGEQTAATFDALFEGWDQSA